eukprot:3080389-Amphidinium_carterae.2
MEAGKLKAASPITSGGLKRCVALGLPKDQLESDKTVPKKSTCPYTWELPAVFRWIAGRCAAAHITFRGLFCPGFLFSPLPPHKFHFVDALCKGGHVPALGAPYRVST